MVETQLVPCNICNSNEASPFVSKAGFSLVKCDRCGLVYVNPRPSKEVVYSRYSSDYFQKEYLPYLEKSRKDVRRLYKNILDLLCEHVQVQYSRKMLEIACGTGLFMHLAQQRGFAVEGIEYNQSLIEHGMKNYGLKITRADIDEVSLPSSYYNAVVLLDFIEHCLDPFRVLSECYNCLKPNGVIFLSTPNIESKPFEELGGEWDMIGPSEHLYYFTKQTIKQILEKAGLTLLLINYGNEDLMDVLFVLAKKIAP